MCVNLADLVESGINLTLMANSKCPVASGVLTANMNSISNGIKITWSVWSFKHTIMHKSSDVLSRRFKLEE